MAEYLITGMTGFAGPYLANRLIEDGHRVHGLIRNPAKIAQMGDTISDERLELISYHFGDITDPDQIDSIFKSNHFDGVFHLAAQSHPPTSFMQPELTFAINATGTINIARSLARYLPECRLLFCSTAEVYGSPKEAGPITEDHTPIAPITPYGVSKTAADIYLRERARSANLPFFVVRTFGTTGPRRPDGFSISTEAYQLARIKQGLQEPSIRSRNLSSQRVFMDVRDCVRAYYLLMANATAGEAYNVAGDTPYVMEDLIDQMIELEGLGKIEKVVDSSQAAGISLQIADTSKLKELTGWKIEIPMRQTLLDLLSYCHKQIS